MADAIERFNEHIGQFKKKTRPVTFLDLMAEDVAKNLFGGFCYALNMRVSVKYAEEFPVTIENIKTYNPLGTTKEKELKVFHPVCRRFRIDFEHDEVCQRWTRGVALKYYEGTWKKPKMYHCQNNLWDMAYPIRVEGNLLGVIFGGQTLVKDGPVRWREELSRIIDKVTWDVNDPKKEIPEESNEVDDVVEALKQEKPVSEDKSIYISPGEQKTLGGIARDDPDGRNVEAEGLVVRFQEFLEFGKMVENLLREVYSSRKEAARYVQIHKSSEKISRLGDQLSEEPEQFWNCLDEVVTSTIPHIKGYVFYNLDRYGEGFEPARTRIFEKGLFTSDAAFRNFCKHIFKGFRQEKFVIYDLKSTDTSVKYRDLFQGAIGDWEKVLGGASVVGIRMVLGDERIRGGLICVSTKDNVDFRWGEGTISKKYLEFYVETLAHIVSILAMVLGRHAAEEQRIASQAVRSHELVAPVHAIRGFHDNLSFMFKHEIKKKAEGLSHPDALEQFEKQLDRLGDLCRLLGLVATACSIEETGTFQQTDFMRGIVFPVVPPLHAYALAQKKTKVRYSREFFEVPRVWVSEEGIKRCIFNLVLNAVKYANRRSTVRVDVNIGGEYFDILVVNEGIGVPAGEEEKIFERFRQGSNARKVAAYGAGIGLYVSRTIARALGGDVKLVDASQESTTFRLRLPRSLEDEPGLDIEGARS